MGYNLLSKNQIGGKKNGSRGYIIFSGCVLMVLVLLWLGSNHWVKVLQEGATRPDQTPVVARQTRMVSDYGTQLQKINLLVPDGMVLQELRWAIDGLSILGQGQTFAQVADFGIILRAQLPAELVVQVCEPVVSPDNQGDSVQFILAVSWTTPKVVTDHEHEH